MFMGFFGLGDLLLMCNLDFSCNYQYGLVLGKGCNFDGLIIVEGVVMVKVVVQVVKVLDIDMFISQVVVKFVDGIVIVKIVLLLLLFCLLKEE